MVNTIVTPFVGVWIETFTIFQPCEHTDVTPFVGVWIETDGVRQRISGSLRHTLRGCVD